MLDVIVEVFQIVANKWQLVLGLVALVGLLLQGVPGIKVFQGVVKTIIGVMILQVGSSTLLGAFRPAMEILQKAFNLTGVVMDPYGGWMAALDNLGNLAGTAAQIMVLGFLINLLLARLTPLKYVYLTGHTMLAFTSFVAWILKYFYDISAFNIVVLGSIIAGIYWTILPAWVHKYSRSFAGDQFTLGHMSGMGTIIGSLIGSFVGKSIGNKDVDESEDIQLTGLISIFNDNIVATTLLMTVFLGGICLISGESIVKEYAGSDNWILWSLFLGAQFAVGINILLIGVRMMLAEIVPAFKGISEKIIPGAIPALDMPVFFTFAPTAAVLGFITTFVGEFIGMFILLLTGSTVITIPGVIPTFFDGGTLGVFAYHYGGRRAVIISGVIVGMLQMFGGALLAPLANLTGAVYPNTDYTTVWVGLTGLMKLLSNVWVFMGVFLALTCLSFWILSPRKSCETDVKVNLK